MRFAGPVITAKQLAGLCGIQVETVWRYNARPDEAPEGFPRKLAHPGRDLLYDEAEAREYLARKPKAEMIAA